jgi:hypothetical protein
VWTSFSRHSPHWRVVENFHSPNQKTTWDQQEKQSVKGENTLARLYFYSPVPSSTRIWRVVIRTLILSFLPSSFSPFLIPKLANNHFSILIRLFKNKNRKVPGEINRP